MKIGLALSGGGVKGAAHIGVIKALQENGIAIEMVGGTSAGSIVAALYAMGYEPKEMIKLFNYFSKMILKGSPTYMHPDGKKTLSIHVGGLLSGESIAYAVKEAAKYKKMMKIKDLKTLIAIPAVDIDEAKKYVFTNSSLEKTYYLKEASIDTAVRASSSYPGVFAPCIYRDHKLVDGGVLDNVPADEVKKMGADIVIAAKFALNKKSKTKGLVGVATKAVDIMFDKRSLDEVAVADYVLNIDTKNANVFDVKKIQDCYMYGYEQTIVKIKEIKEVIKRIEEEKKSE